jgi:ribosomal protein S18 acetylase RimI-like enzyme
MAELASLLTLAPEAMAELWAEEARSTARELSWELKPLPHPLPGLAWREGGQVLSYLAIRVSGPSVALVRLFTSRRAADPGAIERTLLDTLLRLMLGVPGIERVFGELPMALPGTLPWLEAKWPGRVRARALMGRRATPIPGRPAAPIQAPAAELAPLAAAELPEAADLLLRAHAHRPHFIPDPALRDRDGVAWLLGRILEGQTCGAWRPEASLRLRAPGAGALQGLVLATRMGRDQGHIAEIAVDPGRQRQGLGTALLAAAVAALAASGCRQVHLAVDLDNPEALAFYQQLGFTARHRFPSLLLTPGG